MVTGTFRDSGTTCIGQRVITLQLDYGAPGRMATPSPDSGSAPGRVRVFVLYDASHR